MKDVILALVVNFIIMGIAFVIYSEYKNVKAIRKCAISLVAISAFALGYVIFVIVMNERYGIAQAVCISFIITVISDLLFSDLSDILEEN